MSYDLLALIEISLAPDIGIVKAMRIAKECKALKQQSDSEHHVLRVWERGWDRVPKVLKCLRQLRGFTVISLKCLIKVKSENIHHILRKAGFSKITFVGRIVGYKTIEKGLIVIAERTTDPKTIVLKLCKAQIPTFPLPPSACCIMGYDPYEEALRNISILRDVAKDIASVKP